MTDRALLIEVRLFDGRYPGVGDWPPSPFRLFQALVAGAYGGRWVSEPPAAKDNAFAWLEKLDPPVIAGPPKRALQATNYYVPNNDLDAVGGDPNRVAEIRVAKTVRPLVLVGAPTVLYAWAFADGDDHAALLCRLADRLHHLGRGIDPAFARAERTDWAEAEARLIAHGGAIARPAGGGDPARDRSCPMAGSLASLKERHDAAGTKFALARDGRTTVTHFRQPPKPVFRTVAYDRPPARLLYAFAPPDAGPDAIERGEDGAGKTKPAFRPQPVAAIAALVETVRDRAIARMAAALGEERRARIEAALKGSKAATEADKAQRVRLIPLPSIGHTHADGAIRRLLVEVPPDCPLPASDIGWAFAGLEVDRIDPDTGEFVPLAILDSADDRGMLRHCGIENGRPSHRWRTITPALTFCLPLKRC